MLVRTTSFGFIAIVLLCSMGRLSWADPATSDPLATELVSDRLSDPNVSLATALAPSSVDNSCCYHGCGPLERWLAAEPWKMPQPCLFENLGIHLGGWLEAGMMGNADDSLSPYNGTIVANDRHGEPQMNELWLFLHRPIDTSKTGFDVGGRVDFFYGTDWRYGSVFSRNWESQYNSEDQLYGVSIPQLYLEAGVEKLSVRMGHMGGILGYEVLAPMKNFFYSHSYALVYGEAYLITGLMGRYELSEQWEILSGFHRGYYMFEDINDSLNYQGGVRWTDPSKRVSLAYALDFGRNDAAEQSPQYVQSLVFTFQASPRLLYALQSDYGCTNDSALAGGRDALWYGINQYLVYTINKKWAAGLRAEWFRDADGTRVVGLGSLGYRGWEGARGYAGDFYEITMGLNWKPKANIWVRPEVRWDWYRGLPNPHGPDPLPFDGGTRDDQFTFGTDLIVAY